MDMDESGSKMDYDEEINQTKKRIETELPKVTHGTKDKNWPKEKVTRKKTPYQQRTTVEEKVDEEDRQTEEEEVMERDKMKETHHKRHG